MTRAERLRQVQRPYLIAFGVLVVGAMSVTLPELFPDETVWSNFGKQYFYVPLVLPALGLWWLLRGADSTR